MSVNALEKLPREFAREFVPADLDIRDFAAVEPLLEKLLQADLSTSDRLLQWLKDRSELFSAIDEYGARVYIYTSLDTANADYKQAFMDFVSHFEPKLKPVVEKLNRMFERCAARAQLNAKEYEVYQRSVLNQLELFRQENIPLETKLSKLTNRYEEIQGAITISFEGKELTSQQMGPILRDTDRKRREAAFMATAERRAQDADALNELFETQIRLREKTARNAGFDNFRDYQFRQFERFEYTPDDCQRYHEAVVECVLPAIKRMTERRRMQLSVDTLRPWDLQVDPRGRPALKPFSDVERLKAGCSAIFHKVDPELGGQFDRLRELGLLDLDNRKGKAPGGYQATLAESRLPFIFMNAVGLDSDIRTLLHEGGHAFHSLASRSQMLQEYRHGPMEFNEVASMSMELLGNPYLDEFYEGEDLQRARVEFLEEILVYLPWYAIVDSFQHWIYTREGHTTDERIDAWMEIHARFDTRADWSGLDQHRRILWQRQGHLYFAPFYYIEYAIAQIGALQVWLNARKDRPEAIRKYRHALSLGGSRKLPELFKAAGIRFDMGVETLAPLVELVEAEIEACRK